VSGFSALLRASLLIVVLLPLAPARAGAGTWEAIESLAGHPPVSVIVDGVPRLYYRLSPERPLIVPVEGPARLRLTSRAEFGRARGVVSYTLVVKEGTHEIEREETESSPSSRVHLREGGVPVGKSRRMTVDVPAGRHELRLETSGVPGLLVRMHLAAAGRDRTPTVSLTPVDAWRSVIVAEGEKSIPYHSVGVRKPIRVRVVGPTTLELISRLDFDATMRGTQTYRLSVSERGRRLRDATFKTTKATTATYTNLADRVPSKFDRFTMTVGAGTHEFLIELLSPATGIAEIHVRMPEPSVGNEE